MVLNFILSEEIIIYKHLYFLNIEYKLQLIIKN